MRIDGLAVSVHTRGVRFESECTCSLIARISEQRAYGALTSEAGCYPRHQPQSHSLLKYQSYLCPTFRILSL